MRGRCYKQCTPNGVRDSLFVGGVYKQRTPDGVRSYIMDGAPSLAPTILKQIGQYGIGWSVRTFSPQESPANAPRLVTNFET